MAFHLESLAAGGPSKAAETTGFLSSGVVKRGNVGQVPGPVVTININQHFKRRMCSEGSGIYLDLSSPAGTLADLVNCERNEPSLP